MKIKFKDRTATLRHFEMHYTYSGLIEGSRNTASNFIMKREQRNIKKGYYLIEPIMCAGRYGDELPPFHYTMFFRELVDHEYYDLEISFYAGEPKDCEPLRDFINRFTKHVNYRENAELFDIDNF